MSEPRRVPIVWTSAYGEATEGKPSEVVVSSLEDLEALSAKYGEDLIIKVGDDGKLSRIEVYDDYRE